MDHLEEELGRMDTQIDHLAKTIAAEVTTAVATDLEKLNRHVGGLATLVGQFRTRDENISKQLLDLQQGYDTCLTKLATTIDSFGKSHIVLDVANNLNGTLPDPLPTPGVEPPITPSATDVPGVTPGTTASHAPTGAVAHPNNTGITATHSGNPGILPPGIQNSVDTALRWSANVPRPPLPPLNTNLPP
jgi:hypothetical protein